MNPNRSLHKLLRIIFSEVLMEYFDISGWHDDSSKIEVWLDVHQKFLYGLKRSLQGGKRSSQDDEADGIFFRPLSGGSACPESGR